MKSLGKMNSGKFYSSPWFYIAAISIKHTSISIQYTLLVYYIYSIHQSVYSSSYMLHGVRTMSKALVRSSGKFCVAAIGIQYTQLVYSTHESVHSSSYTSCGVRIDLGQDQRAAVLSAREDAGH